MANESMTNEQLDALIAQLENYIECWKQFNRYLTMARNKKFQQEDEEQFLEIKSIMTQELELIFAQIECKNPTREDVHALIGNASSLGYLSDLRDDSLQTNENAWHKIYIAWQSILGQMKVKRREMSSQPRFKSWFVNK
jgi:hypothetical protein